MNAAIDAKIHIFLVKSLDSRRNQIIIQQAAAALKFELIDERIEEREYDEQERLRVDRVINRKVFRGEAYERYSTLVVGLREQGADHVDLESRVRSQLDSDLRAIASDQNVRNDPGGSLQRYSELVPSDKWPVILCMAQESAAIDLLKNRLVSQGFSLLPAEILNQFGIVKLTCPPEMSFVREIAGLPETCTIADALTPVTIPVPMAVTTMMIETRGILGATPDMRARYGQDVTLAVLDTGLDRNHPAFTRIASGDYRDFTSSGAEDVDGHGSHVASIAAGDDTSLGGEYSGIAPRCHLIAGKVLSPGRAGNLESILQGMAWAVIEKRADILSLSLGEMGTPPNGQSIWSRACDEAFRRGTVVCVAAGNPMPSYPESISVPGDCTTAVTVGAIDKARHLAVFSAQGSANPDSPLYGKPNCVGPGVDIVAARSSTAVFDASEIVDALHVRLSGTSMATPAVAGCLTLLKSKARSLGWETTPAELVELLYVTCRPFQDAEGRTYRSDIQVGHGLVNMAGAFQEAERRAPAHAHADAITTPPKADLEGSQDPGKSAGVRVRFATSALEAFQPDVCYHCGKRYLTKVGVFSPARECRECEAPICQICWQLGHRTCEKHEDSVAAAGARLDNPISIPTHADAPVSPRNIPKGLSPMTSSDFSSQKPPTAQGAHWGETFLNRFDLKVRNAARVTHPRTEEEFNVDPKVQAQRFRRVFGDVTQFPLTAGLLKKGRLTLAAIRLETKDLAATGEVTGPSDDILQQVAGPDGLDFKDGTFYCVGIFSPAGWPEEWKSQAEARGNALFYLVEKREGTCWTVFGPKSPLRDLFDPETGGERKARAEKALATHPRLVLSGDQIPMDSFLEEHYLDRESAEAAIQTSGGRFQILEHKGKSYIQMSIR